MKPYEVSSAVEIPGWGQVKPDVINDALTIARACLENDGPLVAVRHLPTLEDMVQQGTWRSEEAVTLILVIQRRYLKEMGAPLERLVRLKDLEPECQ